MRGRLVSPAGLLLLVLFAPPCLSLTQGNGFRWFWRGSSGGSSTHKFSVSSRGGSTSGSHSMVVVRVKDSKGRTVLLDQANAHTSRRVVHGFSGKGANKSTFTISKTIGGITPEQPQLTKPAKYMRPPPVKPTEAAPQIAENLVPSRWFIPPPVDATPKTASFLHPTRTPKPTFGSQPSSRLVLSRPAENPSRSYLPPKAPQGNSVPPATSAQRTGKSFHMTPPEQTSPPAPAPTPTPASHVAKDIRRNLSGRVDGSVFFGILPVVNDLQRMPQAKTEPPPEVVISRRAGKCPFINMTRCPASSANTQRGRCSNDSQCPAEQRCCYNPCATSSQCMTAVL